MKRKLYEYWRKLAWNPGYLNPFIIAFWVVNRWRGVPFRQAATFYVLLKFTAELEKSGIEVYLRHGTLLGAVRQSAFAGRPKDLDFFIKGEDLGVLLGIEKEMAKVGFKMRPVIKNQHKVNFYCKMGCGRIQVRPYQLVQDEASGKRHYVAQYLDRILQGDYTVDENLANKKKLTSSISAKRIEQPSWALIFGQLFRIPGEPEEILVDIYGSDWRVPNSKQFSWRKENPQGY